MFCLKPASVAVAWLLGRCKARKGWGLVHTHPINDEEFIFGGFEGEICPCIIPLSPSNGADVAAAVFCSVLTKLLFT